MKNLLLLSALSVALMAAPAAQARPVASGPRVGVRTTVEATSVRRTGYSVRPGFYGHTGFAARPGFRAGTVARGPVQYGRGHAVAGGRTFARRGVTSRSFHPATRK
jgi:hypothetical protein